MQTDVKTLWPAGKSVVVSLDVDLEEVVWVDTVRLQTVKHLLGAEVGESWVVNLDAGKTLGVKGLELLLVGLGQVGEELLVVGVDLLRVALAWGKTQVEVWRWWHGELGITPLLLWQLALQVLPLLKVWALLVLDLASADDCEWVLHAGLLEGRNWWSGQAVKVPWRILDLLETTQLLEETTEVDLAVVLAGADWADAQLLLLLDNVGDSLVLSSDEVSVGELLSGVLLLSLLEVVRAEEGANVLSVEWKSHDGQMWLCCMM